MQKERKTVKQDKILKEPMLKLKFQYFGHLIQRIALWERP